MVPVLDAALHDPRAELRGAAARALRLVDDAAADRSLAAVITGDKEAAVRADAIFAASFRKLGEPTLLDALLKAASADPAEHVRVDAVGLLRAHQTVSSKIRQTLAAVAARDPKPGVRRLAREALAVSN